VPPQTAIARNRWLIEALTYAMTNTDEVFNAMSVRSQDRGELCEADDRDGGGGEGVMKLIWCCPFYPSSAVSENTNFQERRRQASFLLASILGTA